MYFISLFSYSMTKSKSFAVCKCIYEKNIFLRDLKMHVTFQNDQQFVSDYSSKIENIDEALKEAREEAFRRKAINSEMIQRRKLIKNVYQPLHPNIYTFDPQFLDPNFLSLTRSRNITQVGKGLFTFPVFTQEFCEQFLAELRNFKDAQIPHRQPNTMNRYGILLDEILGFSEFFDCFRINYLQDMVRRLYPNWHHIHLDSQKGK